MSMCDTQNGDENRDGTGDEDSSKQSSETGGATDKARDRVGDGGRDRATASSSWWGAREKAPTCQDCYASDFVAGRQVVLSRVTLATGAWVCVPCTYEAGFTGDSIRFWIRVVVHPDP